ncbi:MAG TPA: hypothetical protein PKM27_02185 [Saprospiraceae bacterium]|nr:hypothetical protein [Saprospiraceae bacterium]HNT20629.1 hypothetical protein [Saprospiraceae bacterium]
MSDEEKKIPPDEFNRSLSRLLNQIAECYRYLGPAQHFRANASGNLIKGRAWLRE